MNLFEAGYALGLALVEGESQLYHKFGVSPESRHKQQRHGWNLYGGKFDDANEVNAFDKHMDERKRAARHTGKIGAAVGGLAGAGLAHRYLAPKMRRNIIRNMRREAAVVRGNDVIDRIAMRVYQQGIDAPYEELVRRDARKGVAQARQDIAKELSAKYWDKVGKLTPFLRKHAGKIAAGAGLGLGALALGGAAYMKTRWSKDKRAHKYDEKTRSYKPVA